MQLTVYRNIPVALEHVIIVLQAWPENGPVLSLRYYYSLHL